MDPSRRIARLLLVLQAQAFERLAASIREAIEREFPDGEEPPVAEPPVAEPPVAEPPVAPPPCPPDQGVQIGGFVPGIGDDRVTSAVFNGVNVVQPSAVPDQPAVSAAQFSEPVRISRVSDIARGAEWAITDTGGVALNGVTLFHSARLESRAVELAIVPRSSEVWVRTETGAWWTVTSESITPQPHGPAGPGE